MLQSFIKGGKLKRWLGRPDCPEAIKQCKALFDRSFPTAGGEEDLDMDEEMASYVAEVQKKPQATPADLFLLTKLRHTILHARFKSLGVVYSRSATHLGNSLVNFYPSGDKASAPIPGSIKYIYSRDAEICFAVQRQLPCTPSDGVVDPFTHYPHFAAKLYQARVSESLEEVKVGWVSSHFARWNMTANHAVVLSLSKVHSSLTSTCTTDKYFTRID